MTRFASLFILLQLAAVTCAAQSLADVARKEEQRREHVKKSTKVYTNADLKKTDAPPLSSVSTGAAEPSARSDEGEQPADDEAAAAEKPATSSASKGDEPRGATQEEWHTRMADAQEQLRRTRMFADALQTRANALWADFTARDDPAQRSLLDQERKKTLAELDRVKAEIQAQTKAIADLEEDARKAGVPPGWLR
jgi:hypothetical protein